MARNPSWKVYRNRWNAHARELSSLAAAERASENPPTMGPPAPIPLRQPRTARAIKAKAERETKRAAALARVRQALAEEKFR